MQLDDNQFIVQATARRFAEDHLTPFAEGWDRNATFPSRTLLRLGSLGFLGMLVPKQFGGMGADHMTYAVAMEEIAAGCGAVAAIMNAHNAAGCLPIHQYGTDEQKGMFLPMLSRGDMLSCFCLTEPHDGSDASTLRSTATRNGDNYILNGTKQFVTTGAHADIALVFARTGPDDGAGGISAFILPTVTTGYQVLRRETKMGQRAADTCMVHLDNAQVDAKNRLGAEGDGHRIAMANLDSIRIGIAAQAVGMARAAFDFALVYAKEQQRFGQPIIARQAVAFHLANMATEIEAARQLVYHAAAWRDTGRDGAREAAMAKLTASEMAERVCSDALQILSDVGYMTDHPLERMLRDVHAIKVYEDTDDSPRVAISRSLTQY